MKSIQRTSAKRYNVVIGKLQMWVFSVILLALMAVSFGFGYRWGADSRSAPGKLAEAEVKQPPLEIAQKGKDEQVARMADVTQEKAPETKTEATGKSMDVIKPKFYQDLLKENQGNEQPIEPIKLPVAKKETLPKPAPRQSEPASAEKPPTMGIVEEKGNLDNTAQVVEKPVQAVPRASKPWAKVGGFTIQVVSFKQFDEALRVVRKLRNAGFQPYIKNADLGSRGKWYRVRVGHFRDKVEAKKKLSEMQVKLKLPRAIIIAM